MKNWILYIILCTTLFSCSTKKSSVVSEVNTSNSQEVIDTNHASSTDNRKVSEQKDSVWVHDSVFVYTNGDTVYLYKEKKINKYITKHDTVTLQKRDTLRVYVSKSDSIDNTYIEKTEVKKTSNIIYYIIGIAGIILIMGVFSFVVKKAN